MVTSKAVNFDFAAAGPINSISKHFGTSAGRKINLTVVDTAKFSSLKFTFV